MDLVYKIEKKSGVFMKLILATFLTLVSLSAAANCNREAQFIGTVTNLSVGESTFSFQLKHGSWFIPSQTCPLFEQEFESAVIILPGRPNLIDGEEISGVLVFDQATQSYKID